MWFPPRFLLCACIMCMNNRGDPDDDLIKENNSNNLN